MYGILAEHTCSTPVGGSRVLRGIHDSFYACIEQQSTLTGFGRRRYLWLIMVYTELRKLSLASTHSPCLASLVIHTAYGIRHTVRYCTVCMYVCMYVYELLRTFRRSYPVGSVPAVVVGHMSKAALAGSTYYGVWYGMVCMYGLGGFE